MNNSGKGLKNVKRDGSGKRLTYMLVQLLVLILLASCGSAPPPVAEVEPEATLEAQATAFTSTLVAKHSGKCLDLTGGSSSNASPFEQEACSTSEAPEFEFIAVSGQTDTYLIKNKHSQKCLDVYRAYKADRTPIIQYNCGNVAHRQFKLLDAGNGYYQLKAEHSGKCVDVRWALKKDGAEIIQYSCQSSSVRQQNGNQLWKITKNATASSTAPSSAPSSGDPSSIPSTNSATLSVNLMGAAPEKKTVTFRVSKPKYTDGASLQLWAYDADKALKGKLYINGNGPIKLFGSQASSANHNVVRALTYETPAYWWKDGDNKLEFIHDNAEGFRIDKGEVSFSVASVSGTISVKEGYDLRGNPGFSEFGLTTEQRRWYDRLWKAINNPEQYPNATELAQSDDTYTYRGDLQDYNNALLTAFRMTGDLRLLDEVSRLSELMRQELKDEWRDSLTGDNGKKDGYLNWVTRYSPKTNRPFIGNDTQMAYDLKAHAHVALFAWAFENNRDLKSPGGYDYAKQADFWEDYLVNHFEAKWRSRNGKATGFPFAEQTGLHTYHSFMKWHHYMGKLTGKSAYTQEAERMADILWQNEFKEVSTQYGTGLVWPRGVLSLGSRENYLHPQDYARYVVEEAIDLHFEGFNRYAHDWTIVKMARTTAAFVLKEGSFEPTPYTVGSRDIGGGKSRAGIPASPTSWGEMNKYRFAETGGWSYLAAWDRSSNNKIEKASVSIYNDVSNAKWGKDPKRVFIPVGMLVKETVSR